MSSRAAGVAAGQLAVTLQLLETGHSGRAAVSGPLAPVVQSGSQHPNDTDLKTMDVFLQPLTHTQDVSKPDAISSAPSLADAKLPASIFSLVGSLYKSTAQAAMADKANARLAPTQPWQTAGACLIQTVST